MRSLVRVVVSFGVLFALMWPAAGAAQESDPELDRIRVSPFSAELRPGETYTFIATGRDQQGNPVPALEASWSTDGGSITDAGVYTAPSIPGEYTVTATVGNLTASADITVAEPTEGGLGWVGLVWIAVILGAVGGLLVFIRMD